MFQRDSGRFILERWFVNTDKAGRLYQMQQDSWRICAVDIQILVLCRLRRRIFYAERFFDRTRICLMDTV